ncbi:MAG TPA: class I mannose-6-phosphate isomerase, partial [Armatimonadota bacterium]|nr:class I mannose-6-phosphate isomerase [Armatimonadota bacterium]
MCYPLRFTPIYKEKVWGGRRLETLLGRALPPDQPIGEAWEVSDHPHGRSVVANGPDAGTPLDALIARHGAALLGARVAAEDGARFPLLVKYLDAEKPLSVQVHPDDAYAAEHAGELGKTEMWYVLHAEPDACLIAGLRAGVTREAFADALAHGDPAALLHRLPVSAGDTLFIPAGRIHAILPGLLLLEIQQNSDTTYRLYDWGRVGLDGTPRALHADEAMAVANWHDYEPRAGIVSRAPLGDNVKTVL